ncbi:MAG: PAS domain S-box protein [Gemmatimonadota bacterium]
MSADAGTEGETRTGGIPDVESPSMVTDSVDWGEVFRQAPVGVAVVGPEGRPLIVNDALAEMLGYAPDELRGTPFPAFTHPDDVEKDLDLYRQLVAGEIDHYRIDKRFITGEDRVLWGELYVTRAPGDTTDDPGFVAFVRDITERRRAEEEVRRSEERYRSLFEHSREAIVLTDREGTFHQANAAFLELTGYSAGQLRELTADDLYADPDRRRELIQKLEASGHVEEFEMDLRRADGEVLHCVVTTNLRPGVEDGATVQAIVRDVTDQKEREAELREQALHDALTGLPNRKLFRDRLEQALAALSRSEEGCLALLFVDLDGFKEINDRHGHAVGDRMLEKIAGRLAELVRESDTVARHGGDEFVVLLRDLEATEEAELVARRICEGAGGVEPIEASPTGLTVSVGVTLVADGGDPRALPVEDALSDPDEALRRADQAMYRAKQEEGSSCWVHRAGEDDGGA